MKHLLPKLTDRLATFHATSSQLSVPKFITPVPQEEDEIISQNWLWPRVGQFFRKGDVVVAETGTSSFGTIDIPLPEDAVFVSQILWGSIGWTVGATLGAAVAARDIGKPRTILFVGDGSLQLTVQELSVMLRLGVTPILFVLNNSGYTIERYLHGEKRKYNDITNWSVFRRPYHFLSTLSHYVGFSTLVGTGQASFPRSEVSKARHVNRTLSKPRPS